MALQPGDRVEAAGFLGLAGSHPTLEEAVLRRVGPGRPPQPLLLTAAQAARDLHDARLVRIKGYFVGRLFEPGEDALVLQDGDVVFNARLGPEQPQESLASLQPGSLVQLTGVCSLAHDARARQAFQILLRSASDLVVLDKPSWWTVSRVRWLLGAMTGVFALALAWAAMLRVRVRRQTGIIRERLEREAALDERYRDLVEHANDLVFSLDRGGRLSSINEASLRILGYSPPELLGKSLSEIASPRSRAPELQAIAGASGETGPLRYELEVLAKDGSTVILDVSAWQRLRDGGDAGRRCWATSSTSWATSRSSGSASCTRTTSMG